MCHHFTLKGVSTHGMFCTGRFSHAPLGQLDGLMDVLRWGWEEGQWGSWEPDQDVGDLHLLLFLLQEGIGRRRWDHSSVYVPCFLWSA